MEEDVLHFWDKAKTFEMTNISHQAPEFNRGIWKRLEKEILTMSESDELVVVTVPILEDWFMTTAGAEHVTVPKRFAKIAANQRTGVVTAWMIPNEAQGVSTSDFLTSVEDVEKASGLKFKNLK